MAFDCTAQAGADGSARVAHGLTDVLVSVFGPREARVRAQTLHDRATIHVEATIAPFSASERRRRGRGDKCVSFFFFFDKEINGWMWMDG
jgi:exosome complex component RRP41